MKKNAPRPRTPAGLKGKVCLVTGGAQGIGLAITHALVQQGAHVHVADISAEHLASAAAGLDATGLRGQITLQQVDVSDRAAYEQYITEVHKAGGRLDVLVNNAAYVKWADVADMSVEDTQLTMRTAYDATVVGVNAVLPLMRSAGGGAIVNMGSAAGVVFVKGPAAAYAASKAAINAYTQVLAGELIASPVHVMLVRPGTVGGTEFFGRRVPSHLMPRIADFLPVSTPEQVAAAVINGLLHQREIVDVPGYLPAMYRAYAMTPGLLRTLASLGGPARRDFGHPARRSASRRPHDAVAGPERDAGVGMPRTAGPIERTVHRVGSARWAGALARAALVPLDTALQTRTTGRFSVGRGLNVASLLLTTTGARTGRPRPTPLFYVDHADGYAVVGSNFGQAHHPAWTTNLLKTPTATVTLAGAQIPVTARLVDGPEHEVIWNKILTISPGYQAYRDRSGRNLRIFHLQPVGSTPAQQ
ncbi:SDR family NAD(P)-dependent oxidoreductase [Streptomyces sp. NPDC001586]|uniref:SDR family NAD(P)-dependent oxidoreductase n=1 Tax=Streptomyces sp. NPDC001586 TaxID=3154387 RepID=UPI0033269A7D